MPYYELYELVLDSNFPFNLVAQVYDPVPTVREPPIF